MSGDLVYPRLPAEAARQLLAAIRDAATGGIEAVTRLAATSHPKAAPVATGGREASADDLKGLRTAVISSVGDWIQKGEVPRTQQPLFDAQLGKALYQALRIMPADAAHAGTWSFLTLVVLPDVAVTRFADLPDERGLGNKRERNVLSRAWMRWEALGDTLLAGNPLLGEDELVGLLERTAVARNRALVRALAAAVLSYTEGARSVYARELYKLVRRRTGPLMLDLLSVEELATLVRAEAAKLGHSVAGDVLMPPPSWRERLEVWQGPPTNPVIRATASDVPVEAGWRQRRDRSDGSRYPTPSRAGVPRPSDPMETLICQTCKRSFHRVRARGRKPMECPDCRRKSSQ